MRIVRGVAALTALLLLLVGIPYGLAIFGGNPLPTGLSGQEIGQALLRPASDRVLIGIVTIAGWLVWAAFAASVIAEIANVLPGRRIRLQLPGLGLGQKFAAVLVIAVVTMIAAPHAQPTAFAEPSNPAPPPSATVSAPQHPTTMAAVAAPAHQPDPGVRASEAPTRKTGEQRHHIHVVERGDWLWNLADQYLGDGARWKDIAAANPGINPDRIDIGQRLLIPLDRTSTDTASRPERVAPDDGDTVRVERGDSLSTIADDLYGTAKHWPDLYQQNRDQIDDPNLIEVGQNLQLPDRPILTDTDHAIRSTPDSDRAEPNNDRGRADTDRQQDEAERSTTNQHADREPPAPTTPSTAPTTQPSTQPSTTAPTGTAQTSTTAPTGAAQTSIAPTSTAAPSTAASSRPIPSSPAADTTDTAEHDRGQAAAVGAVSVGLLLAAGLITALNSRRRRQLHARPPGRQIPTPGPDAAAFEHDLHAQHQPLRFDHLDLATRAIAAHCRRTGDELPALTAARVSDDRIDLLFSEPAASTPPAGFDVAADGSVWTVHATDMAAVRNVAGIDTALPPYPALVTIGRDADTAHVLIDLEAAAALTVAAADPDDAARMMATIAIELALSPWSADLDVTFVGPMLPGFVEGLDHPAVTQIDDADRVLTGLEHRVADRRRNLADGASIGAKRIDPDLADGWCPHVVLFGTQLNPEQEQRLGAIVTDLPRIAIAAVTTSATDTDAAALTTWRYQLNPDGAAQLQPFDWTLIPQLVTDDQYQQLLELVTISGTDDTTPAPWWDHDPAPEPDEALAATITSLPAPAPAPDTQHSHDPDGEHVAAPAETASEPGDGSAGPHALGTSTAGSAVGAATRVRPTLTLRALVTADNPPRTSAAPAGTGRLGGSFDHEPDDDGDGEAWTALTAPPTVDRPMLLLIGAPELVGERGPANRRYKQRSLEILFYLLEHPGTTMPTLTSTFSLSRDYAKSLISNLRKTLGATDDGDLYLPEMGQSPGYRLHDQVTCDLYYVNQLIGRGVNTAPDEILIRILSVVRGEPFLGADDWRLGFNIQAIRTSISSKLTDAAHELTTRALAGGNIDLARWATSQGRTADPLNQTLMADEVRIEAQAGNKAVVARLADRMSATARELGSDLTDDAKEVLRDAIAM